MSADDLPNLRALHDGILAAFAARYAGRDAFVSLRR